jgi:pyrroloquinoline-quinone synthase
MTLETPSLDAVAARYDLLQHSFYQRWLAGEVSREELDDYAGQYAHLVGGLPRWLDAAADADPANAETLRAHAVEELGHVALWEEFALAVGPQRKGAVDRPNRATRALLDRCDALAAGGQGLAVAWALEAQSPEVSATKLCGLEEHYDIDSERGGRYFALHATRDIEHRDQLAGLLRQRSEPAAVEAAEVVLAGLWDMLTSVEKTPAQP